jgi:hypothetical protein
MTYRSHGIRYYLPFRAAVRGEIQEGLWFPIPEALPLTLFDEGASVGTRRAPVPSGGCPLKESILSGAEDAQLVIQ